jgi:uncharacterized protein (TIGR02001 family)
MRTSFRALFAGLLLSTAAHAQDDPAPDFTITGAATVATQYRFRGISQSDNDFVVQGSVMLAHESGFYVSTWESSASAGNSAVNIGGAEIDVYGGYASEIADSGVTADAGVYGYLYPGATGLNYYEVYGSVAKAVGPVAAKVGVYYAPAQGAFDGLATRHNIYLCGDLSGSIPGAPVSLHAHLGRTSGAFAYTKDYLDFSVGAAVKWKALTFDLSLVGTNISRADAARSPFPDRTGTLSPFETHRAAKTVLVGSITASF